MKEREPIRMTAPGSLMLMGEHAVLHGGLALVAAVEPRLTVSLTPRNDDHIHISSTLAELAFHRHEIPDDPRLRFVLETLRRIPPATGIDLEIITTLSHTSGFGTSAAVTVATAAALQGGVDDRRNLFKTCLEIVRAVQGSGSGADLAASVWGGVVAYRAEPLEIETLPLSPPLTVVYSGHKTPTPEVIRQVEARRAAQPAYYQSLYDQLDRISGDGLAALREGDLPRWGELLNLQHGLLENLGVGNADLAAIVHRLRELDGIHGAKISGAGLGDCAIGIGLDDATIPDYTTLPARITTEGVHAA